MFMELVIEAHGQQLDNLGWPASPQLRVPMSSYADQDNDQMATVVTACFQAVGHYLPQNAQRLR